MKASVKTIMIGGQTMRVVDETKRCPGCIAMKKAEKARKKATARAGRKKVRLKLDDFQTRIMRFFYNKHRRSSLSTIQVSTGLNESPDKTDLALKQLCKMGAMLGGTSNYYQLAPGITRERTYRLCERAKTKRRRQVA